MQPVSSNPYDETILPLTEAAGGVGASGKNPYDATILPQEEDSAGVRASVSLATDTNPALFAEQRKHARTAGLPPAAGPAMPEEAKRLAAVDTIVKDTERTPVLRQRYTDADFAKLSHTDSGVLAGIEKAIGKGVAFVMGANPEANLPDMIHAGGIMLQGAAAGAFQMATGAATLFPGPLDALPGGNPLERLSEGFGIIADDARKRREKLAASWGDTWQGQVFGGGLESGVQSAVQNIPLMAATTAAVIAGAPVGVSIAAGLLAMAAGAGGESYSKDIASGAGKGSSLIHGATDAVAEYVFEKYAGFGGFMERALAGSPLTKLFVYELAREVPSEIATTLVQNFNAWATVENKNKSFADFLQEQPVAVAQTIVATLVGGAAQIGGAHAGRGLLAEAARVSGLTDKASAGASHIDDLFARSKDSALRANEPQTFNELIQAMADGNDAAVKSVHVDAQALVDMADSAGVSREVFNQLLPSAAPQMQEALASGGAVELPIGEVVANIPGSKLEPGFVDNIRVTPDSLTRAEVAQSSEAAQTYWQTRADEVLKQADDAQAVADSADVVRQEVVKQLEATKRFKPEVSQRYADLHAAFFTVLAGKLGITPEQAFKKYGASVRSTISPGQVYNGAPRRKPGEISVEGVHFSKEARTSLSGAMYGSNYAGSGKEALLNAKDERLRKRVYFYANKGTGINPEAGVGGFAHKANLTNIYDANSDPLRLRKGDQQAFESAVLDAGFSGYLDRLEGTQSGQVILLGDQNVAVEQMGATTPDASAVPAPAARESLGRDIIIDALAANKTLPAGSPTIERWQEILPDDIKQALAEAGVFDGDQQRTAYKSELAAAYAAATEAPVYGQRAEPLTENDADRAASISEARVSPRLPTGVKSTENGFGNERLQPTIAAMPESMVEKTAAEFLKYPNFAGLSGAPREILEQAKQHMKDNLRALVDAFPTDLRERARMWYVGGNRIARALSETYGVPPENVALAIAALSPQKNWFENVTGGERVIDIVVTKSERPWSAEMTAVANARGWFLDKTISRYVKDVEGKTLRQMYDPADPDSFVRMAWWVRAYDEAHNPRELSVITPEGTFTDQLFTARADGAPTPLRWGSAGAIGKAIAALVARTPEARSKVAGGAHKVRSFFNNIVAPYFGEDVTIDTHAVAAALLRPLGGATPEVQNVLSGAVSKDDAARGYAGIGSSSITGSTGAYGVYADAYREMAAELGMLPRELQSITWEAVRLLYDAKGATLKRDVAEVWTQVGRGELTHEQAIKRIFELAGGIGRPDWASADARPQPLDSSYRRVASQPEGTAEGGGREAAAGAVPDVLQQQAPEGPATLNIGLAIPAGGQLTPAEVNAAIEAFGVKATDSAVVTSDTEPTLVVQLDRALSPEDVDALSRALGQEAIPQLIGNEGTMHGPEKDKWGDFNPYYFRDLKGDRLSEVLGQSAPQTDTKAFKAWFGNSKVVDAEGKPLVVYHGTGEVFAEFRIAGPANDIGSWFAAPAAGARNKALAVENARGAAEQFSYTAVDLMGGNETVYPVYLSINNPREFSSYGAFTKWSKGSANGPALRAALEAEGYDGVVIRNSKTDSGERRDDWVAFRPEQIKSAIGNQGTFDPNDPLIYKQQKPDPLGTFSPSKLEISLLADANLSTFLHETGHFFLEVLGRVATEPNAPKEIVDDLNATLKWFGVGSIEAWNSMTFAEREPYHEKWAESFEQYLLEGKAPSLALRQSFQRFKEFLLGVYKSLKQFLATHRGDASGQDGAFAQSAPSQPDLFPGELATKRTTVKTGREIDTKGTPEVVGNVNSAGQKITGTKQGLQRFWAWFAGSEVTDGTGRPLVLYHSTNVNTDVLRGGQKSTNNYGLLGDVETSRSGVFMTPNKGFSQEYLRSGGGQNVMPLYARIEQPLDLRHGLSSEDEATLEAAGLNTRYVINAQHYWELFDNADDGSNDFVDGLKKAGYDGAIFNEDSPGGETDGGTTYVAFNSEQIKSATGNRGTFDPNDPNILKQGGKPAGPGLNDEVRAIFDRLLATEEQIKEAEAQARFEEIFKSAKDAGMTEDEWKAYQAQHQDATQDALEKMGKLSLADTKWFVAARAKALREAQAAVADKRAEMKAQVTAEVMALPVEQARAEIEQLRASTPEQKAAVKAWNEARAAAVDQAKLELTAALVEANPDAKGIGKGQLLAKNKRAIANQAEAAALEWEKAHPRPKAMPATLEMEVMAERLGYTSADHLRKDMLESPSAKDLIEAMTEQRLLETYGNLVTREGIEQAANEAVYNEARGRFVATELGAMQGAMSKTGPSGKTNRAGKPINVNVITQAAKTFAETVVNRRRIMDLKPAQHTAAASRAAGKAAKLQAEGKTAEAIAAKRDQLLSHFTALYAFKAERSVASQLAYLNKFDKEGVRKSIPQDYLDQIDALLEKIDLRKGTSAKDIARRQSLAKWVDQQHEEGKSPILPPAVLADAQLTSYKQMTVEDFAGLVDSVQNIEHLGRLKGKLLKSADKRAWEAIRDEIVGTIRKFGGKARPDSLEPRGALNQWVHGFWADHRKLDSLAYQMDGGEINGPMFRSFIRGMNDSGAYKASEIAKATQALADIYAPVWALPGGTAGDVRFIPEINNSLSRGGRLAVALNWGNPQNRQRLTQTGVGAPWSEAQVEAILRTLTPTELKFVNDVWAYLDSFWPAVKAKQQRVSGVVEEKVEAVPFDVVASDGTTAHMRGGYYPLVYDNDRSNAAAKRDAMQVAKEMLRGAIGAATTRRGHTKARVESVNEPLRLSLSVITQHVEQVVHDLAWHEWMIDANKILADKQIAAAIKEHYGPEILKTMKANIDGIATGDLTSQTSLDNILLQLKTNLSRAVMGWSMTTALMQPFGLAQSVARVGVAPILKGAGRWAGDAAQMESSMTWIREKSSFMEHRAQTMNREINDISQRVRGKSKTMQVIDRSLFILMQKMQLVADVPTWIGMYERATAEGYDEATSVALADEAVKATQGGGQAQDLANVQRKHPFLTMFYSYFSTTLNLVAEKTAAADFKSPAAVAGWLADMALLVTLPAILPNLLAYAMKGGDDDDPEGWAKRLAKWQASYLLGLFVGLRELGGMVEGFDYAGPPVGRVVVDAGKTAKQLLQGELDEAAVTSIARTMGDLFGIPSTQLIRSYKGWQAWADGDAPATAVLMGPPPKH